MKNSAQQDWQNATSCTWNWAILIKQFVIQMRVSKLLPFLSIKNIVIKICRLKMFMKNSHQRAFWWSEGFKRKFPFGISWWCRYCELHCLHHFLNFIVNFLAPLPRVKCNEDLQDYLILPPTTRWRKKIYLMTGERSGYWN